MSDPETPDILDRLLDTLTASAASMTLMESRLQAVEHGVQLVHAELARANAIEEARAKQSGDRHARFAGAVSSRPAMILWVTLAYGLASVLGLDPGPVLRTAVGVGGE